MSNKDYPSTEMYATPITGDATKDAEIIDSFVLREKRLIEGICANGCGPMIILAPNERECPKCHFHNWSNLAFSAESQ